MTPMLVALLATCALFILIAIWVWLFTLHAVGAGIALAFLVVFLMLWGAFATEYD